MAAKLETIDLPHLPSTLPVHVALYRDVQNAAFLRQQLLAGNSDFEYALIDASMVCFMKTFKVSSSTDMEMQVLSRLHAITAIFRGVNDYMNGRLRSRNLHSEIVFSFSPTNNVGRSFVLNLMMAADVLRLPSPSANSEFQTLPRTCWSLKSLFLQS